MQSRAIKLFFTQVSRESRRIDATVIRTLYAGFALSILWSVSQIDFIEAGAGYLRAMTVVHTAMAVVLAVRLSGDVAGDRGSGLVGLLYLSGVPAGQVISSRVMLTLVSFLSVWLVRVPVLVLAFHLAGTSLHQILQVEALLVGLFCMTCSAGLLVAHYSSDRSTSRMVFLVPGLIEFGLTIPSLVTSILQSVLSFNIPSSVETIVDLLRRLRLSSCLFTSLQTTSPSQFSLSPLVIHLSVTLLSLWAWRRVYYTCLDEAEVAAIPVTELPAAVSTKGKSRPSRPCWDDALAWQAFDIHSEGRWNIIGRSLVIVGCLIGTLLLVTSNDVEYRGFGMGLLVITTLVLMFMGQCKVSDCLQREIKEKTLLSLLLTPHSALDLCDGWGRGARRLMRPDWLLFLACLAGVLLYGPMDMAPIIVACASLLLASGPFFVLSPLVPFSLRGILSGLGLIAIVILILIISVPLSIHVHPWLGTLVVLPLAWGWHTVCRAMIPSWFEKKQEELV